MLDKIKGKLKKVLSRGKKRKYGMPSSYLMVRWKDEVRSYNISGDRAKEIVIIEDGGPVSVKDYTDNMLESLKKNLKYPVWDRTNGQSRPDIDPEIRIDPSEIEVRRI